MPTNLRFAIEEFCVKQGLGPKEEEFLKEILPKVAKDGELFHRLWDFHHAVP